MDMDTTLLYRELQRIADALEENNKIAKKSVVLFEKSNALFEKSLKDNEERHQDVIDLNEKASQTTQSWIDWNIQRAIENEMQTQQGIIEQDRNDEVQGTIDEQ